MAIEHEAERREPRAVYYWRGVKEDKDGHDDLNNVMDLADISLGDVASVGGKNASLGELFRALKPKGVSVLVGLANTSTRFP